MIRRLFFLLALFACLLVKAQVTNRADASLQPWAGKWIGVPGASPNGYGVYLFRKEFDLATVPSAFPVQISADNRYKLYVNGKLASHGPARGDLYFWNYESVDLSAFLVPGKNVLAALVWNEGEFRPEAQMTFQTAFVLNGSSLESKSISTDASWKCITQNGYAPIPVRVNAYYVAGAGESVDMSQQLIGWRNAGFNDSNWKSAQVLGTGMPKGVFRFDYRWMLVQSSLPQMEVRRENLETVRRSTGINVPIGFPFRSQALRVPARTRAVLMLDQSRLTNAYFNLRWDGGQGTKIRLVYAETLTDAQGVKGDRNAIDGKTINGRTDELLSSGASGQEWTSLWWRTFRYVELTIETEAEPLQITDIFGEFTGYPFQRASTYSGDGSLSQKILDIGWHTARLCAVETYMDCPYYEQLQYIGDTRIQAMVTYYNSSDRRLARNALNIMDQSQISEGLTLSRHPSYTPQIIPTFSMWYIHLLDDYRMYNDDEEFIREKVVRSRPAMKWFAGYQDQDGSIRHLPYWVFTDWVDAKDWDSGVAPMGADGSSAIVDIQYYWTLQVAARLEKELGSAEVATEYQLRADRLKETIRLKYWSSERQLFADRKEKDVFSQHANALAILAGLLPSKNLKDFAVRVFAGHDMAPASIYFKYYLHLAGVEAGLGAEYFSWLSKWEENIRLGLTTWAEMSDVPRSRSDCHAWGASPNVEVFRSILGIRSAAPGFSKVLIRPAFDVKKAEARSGVIPHPAGKLEVRYTPLLNKKKALTGWTADVVMPEGVEGKLDWFGEEKVLKPGLNHLQFNSQVAGK